MLTLHPELPTLFFFYNEFRSFLSKCFNKSYSAEWIIWQAKSFYLSLYLNSEGHFIAKFMQHKLNNHFTLCNDRKKKKKKTSHNVKKTIYLLFLTAFINISDTKNENLI